MTVQQRWKQTSLPNKLLVITGALVAFGTLFYALAAGVQVWLLRESLSASSAALNASIEASHNEQRAWIAIESMQLTLLEADKPLKTEVKIINTGKTIALELFYPGAVQTSWVSARHRELPKIQGYATINKSNESRSIVSKYRRHYSRRDVCPTQLRTGRSNKGSPNARLSLWGHPLQRHFQEATHDAVLRHLCSHHGKI